MKRNLISWMNAKRMSQGLLISSLVLIAMLATSFGAVRQDTEPVKPDESPKHQVTVKSQIVLTDGDVTSTNIWYFFSNGEKILMDAEKKQIIRAEIDGFPIPQERIHFQDGKVTLTDEYGNEIQVRHLLSRRLNDKVMFRIQATTEQFGKFGLGEHWTTRIPEEMLRRIGKFQRPKVMFGIHTEPTSPALEHHLNLEAGSTVMIAGLYEGLPAHRAGIQQYDILLSLNGETPVTRPIIIQTLSEQEPGSEIELTVIQEGETIELTITLEAFDPQRMRQATLIGESRRSRIRGRLGPYFSAEMSFQDLVIAPDSSMYRFLPQGSNDRMNEEIRYLLKKLNRIERRSGMKGLSTIEVILEEADETKLPLSPRTPREEPRE